MVHKRTSDIDQLEQVFAVELRRELTAAIARKDSLFFENDYFDELNRQLGRTAKKIPELLRSALDIKRAYDRAGFILDGCDASKYLWCCRIYCDRYDHNRPGPLKLLEILRSNLPDI